MFSNSDAFKYAVVEESAIKTVGLSKGESMILDARLIQAGAPGFGCTTEHAAYIYTDVITLVDDQIRNDSLLWRELCGDFTICMTLDQYSFWAAEIENDKFVFETKDFLMQYFTAIKRRSVEGDMGLDTKTVKDIIFIYRKVHELMFSRRLWRHWNLYSLEFQELLVSVFCEHRRRFIGNDQLTFIHAYDSIYSKKFIPLNGMACMRFESDFDMPGLDGEITIEFNDPDNHEIIQKFTADKFDSPWVDNDVDLRDSTLPSDGSAEFIIQCKWTENDDTTVCLLTPIRSHLIGPILCKVEDLKKFLHPSMTVQNGTTQTMSTMQTQLQQIENIMDSIV